MDSGKEPIRKFSRGSLRLVLGGAAKESLIVFSDVHLGADLHAQAKETGFGKLSPALDKDLVAFLDYYRQTKPDGDRFRIVINGDFIDFIGMAVPAEESGEVFLTELNDEEKQHGLGNTEDQACAKLRMVARRHTEVFAALARFIAAGNTVSIVRGNHDLEFDWKAVRMEFKALLWDRLEAKTEPAEEFASRIEFEPWFLYAPGLAYIEHGHQYDPYCATDHMMVPYSVHDNRRMWRGFSETLLRYVVRPTRGLRDHGHEKMGIVDYFRFGLSLGAFGIVKLGLRFARALRELFRLRAAYFGEAAIALREEHDRRVALIAEATRIGLDRLKALAALQAPPVTRTIRGILASVLLDKIALAVIAMVAMMSVAIFQARHGHGWYASLIVLVAWAVFHRHLTGQRQIDPTNHLRERAGKLIEIFPAPYVIMGHTHAPTEEPIAGGASTYVNLGSWAEEADADKGPPEARAARTFLLLSKKDSGVVAEFLRWDSEVGPYPFAGPRPAPNPESPETSEPRKAG